MWRRVEQVITLSIFSFINVVNQWESRLGPNYPGTQNILNNVKKIVGELRTIISSLVSLDYI